tara:strand:- start:1549 stop:2211 length:663 start_codon:yes stop_codon:yes gene_type:complete
MSWKFPKYPMENERVLDVDSMNENFLASAQELAGQLNEHNWEKDAFTSASLATSYFEEDSAFVWHSNSATRVVIPHGLIGGSVGANPSDYLVFQERPDWREISESSLSFSCSNCLGWIHGSLQFYQQATATSMTQESNFQFALKIDGAVLSETITGGVEPPQDTRRANSMWVRSVALSLVFPLAPGPHEISIVIRASGGFGELRPAWIASNELICLEMRR